MSDIKRHILAVDGGGVRGIIPARILEEFENRTNRPACKLFDLMIGTSTGGIITLGLATPKQDLTPKYSAADIKQLYFDCSSQIFNRSFWRKLYTGGGLWNAKYSPEGYEVLLKQVFGDILLSQTLCPTVTVSYDLNNSTPFFFDSRLAGSPNQNFYLRDIARATSAAPTYFPPKKLKDMAGNHYWQADGGIYANDPELAGIYETYLNGNDTDLARSSMHVVSIGTGKLKLSKNPSQLVNSGIIGWVLNSNLIDIILNANTDLVSIETPVLFPNVYRLQPDLAFANVAMDDTLPDNLNKLLKNAEDYIQKNDQIIQKLCDEIVSKLK